jgi:hypothetical protein
LRSSSDSSTIDWESFSSCSLLSKKFSSISIGILNSLFLGWSKRLTRVVDLLPSVKPVVYLPRSVIVLLYCLGFSMLFTSTCDMPLICEATFERFFTSVSDLCGI